MPDPTDDIRFGAAQNILDAPPMEVGEIDDLLRELDDIRGARR